MKIFIDSDDEDLKRKYAEYIQERNHKISQNLSHIDAGFDLFCPEDKELLPNQVNKIDYRVVCSAEMCNILKISKNNNYSNISLPDYTEINRFYTENTGFYMYPRSSIIKTPLRLANNVGIIDAGYRGHLIGAFDVLYGSNVKVNKFERHLQICAPDLVPMIVVIVDTLKEVGENTLRGEGGFGSTGLT
jgi:dUTP pyrophosphatase